MIPETEKERNIKERQKAEEDWEEMEEIHNAHSVNQTDQLNAFGFKMTSENHILSREKSELIMENEMPGMRKEIPKDETPNKCGDAARKIEIEAIGNMGLSYGYHFRNSSRGSLIEGRFVYIMKNKPIATGHKRTVAYIDENRKLDAVFCVKGFREFVESNAPAPTVQLQSVRLCLAVIAHRKWDFRATDVSMGFLRSEPLQRDTYVQLPKGVEDDNVAWNYY